MTNTIQINISSTDPISYNNKKERYKIDYTICVHFCSDHIAIYNCHYLISLRKTWVKAKKYWQTGNIKIEKNNDINFFS